MIELIPNCSEYVSRIKLTSDEVVRLREVLKLMSNRQRSLSDSNDLYCWDYFEEYLTGVEGNLVFMGEEEKNAIYKALNLIGKKNEGLEE